MSQIRKYDTGGTFTLMGKTLTGETALEKVREANLSSPGMATQVALQAIMDGNNFEVTPDYSWKVTNQAGEDITSKYFSDKAPKNTDSKAKRNWQAFWNTPDHQERKAAEALYNINMNLPEEKKEATLTALRYGPGKWFSVDNEKKYQRGPINDDYWQIIQGVYNYIKGDDTYRGGYDTSKWKSSNLDTLKNIADNLPEDWYSSIKSKIETGRDLSNQDLQILNLMGFNKNAETRTESEIAADEAIKAAAAEKAKNEKTAAMYKNAGINPDLLGSVTVGFNDDGTISKIEGLGKDPYLLGTHPAFNDARYINSILYNGNIFNDDISTLGIDSPLGNVLNDIIARNGAQDYADIEDYYRTLNKVFNYYNESEGSSPYYWFNPNTQYDFQNKGALQRYANEESLALRDITNSFVDLKKSGYKVYEIPSLKEFNPNGTPKRTFVKVKDGETTKLTEEEIAKQGRIGSGNTAFLYATKDSDGKYLYSFTDENSPLRGNSIKTDGNGNYWWVDDAKKKNIELNGETINQLMEDIKSGKVISYDQVLNYKTPENIIGAPIYSYRNFAQLDPKNFKGKTIGVQTAYGVIYYTGGDAGWEKAVNSNKNGGSINWNKLSKFQYGGYFNPEAVTVGREVTDTPTHAINKPHALDGSDGGLTEAEKWQIGAGIGDIVGAGLALSPDPYTGIASAVVGAGSDVARLVGDVKQDGFQGRDLWNFGKGLFFDVAALPASVINADSAVKIKKAVDTIVSIGSPLLTVLGTYGVADTAIETIRKMQNGEKYTSEDLTNALVAIAQAIVLGKHAVNVKGDSKVASKLSKNAANATTNTKLKVKVGDEDFEVSNKLIDDVFASSKSKDFKSLVGEVKSKIAGEKNVEVDKIKDSDVEALLKKSGYTEGEATLWQRLRNKTPDATAPTRQGEHSAAYYALHPFVRNRVLGRTPISLNGKEKQQSLLDYLDHSIVRPELTVIGIGKDFEYNGYKHTSVGNALRRATNRMTLGEEGKDLGDGLTLEKGTGVFKQNRRPINPVLEKKSSAPASEQAPKTTEKTTTTSEVIEEMKDKTSVTEHTEVEATKKEAAEKAQARDVESVETKKERARKILQEFKNSNNKSREARDEVSKKLHDLYKNLNKTDKKAVRKAITDLEEYSQVGGITLRKEGGQIPAFRFGGLAEKGPKFSTNLIPLATDSAAAAYAWGNINKAYNDDEVALRRLHRYDVQPAQKNLAALQTGPITNEARRAYEAYLSSVGPNTYADLGQMQAFNQMKGQTYSGIAQNEAAALAQAIDSNNATNRAIMDENTAARINAANDVHNYNVKLDYQIDALKGQKRRDIQANVVQPLSQQFRQNIRTAFNQYNELSKQFELDQLNDELKANQSSSIAPLRKEYEDDVKNKNYSGTFESWLAENQDRTRRFAELTSTEGNGNYAIWYNKVFKPKYEDWNKKWTMKAVFKQGGSVYKHKTVQEEMAVQGDKMSKQAVRKMSDHLNRMLQQLLR